MPHVDYSQTFCLAGMAQRDITPPVGIYHRMWGAATHDRATGIHQPLAATVLALRPAAHKQVETTAPPLQVIVSLDHCLLWSADMLALRSAVLEQTALQPEQLSIAMTHTHAAGLMDTRRAALPGGELIAGYLRQLAHTISQAIQAARADLKPVWIDYGVGRCSLAAHRDFWDSENELYVCGYNPAGPRDDTLMVARLSEPQGRIVGTVVNYACHPTTLAWDNTLISPDFVGTMRQVIQASTAAPCLFLQGASGDLGPRRGFVGDVKVAEQNGRQLGYAALSTLEGLPAPGMQFEYTGPIVSGATIGAWAERPVDDLAMAEKQRWHCERFVIDLPYRKDLPTMDQTLADLARWQADEQRAMERGDAEQARDCRAQSERMLRQIARLEGLPPGDSVPLSVTLSRLGDAFWLLVAGEHYHVLQQGLRERFGSQPIMVSTVTNGWLPGYLPSASTYGMGIYQESIAVVAPGSLELVIETIARRISALGGQ